MIKTFTFYDANQKSCFEKLMTFSG